MNLNTNNLEILFREKENHSGYFLGEYRNKKGRFNDEEYNVIILFSIPAELCSIINKYTLEDLPYKEAVKLTDTYLETNICINGHFPPFQQSHININKFSTIIPIEKYPKDGLKILLNAENNKSIYGYKKSLEIEF